MSVWLWKKLINNKLKEAALEYLNEENCQREKTKEITFSEIKMSEYLSQNRIIEIFFWFSTKNI